MNDKMDLRQMPVKDGDLVLLVNAGQEFSPTHPNRIIVAKHIGFTRSRYEPEGKEPFFYASRAVVFNAGAASPKDRNEEWKGGKCRYTGEQINAFLCTTAERIEVGEEGVRAALRELSPNYTPDIEAVINYKFQKPSRLSRFLRRIMYRRAMS